jgi:hypothetical protein
VIGRTWRASALVLSLVLVASCGQLFERDSPRNYWSTHTVGELCRYPLDFFTNHLHYPGLEVGSRFSNPDQKIDGLGACSMDGPKGSLSSRHVSVSLGQADGKPVEGLTPAYREREPIRVGADTVRVWSRDSGLGRQLRVDIDGWTGDLTVMLITIGEPTPETALPDEHLPAAAEMLVRMTRDLKGPSRQPAR